MNINQTTILAIETATSACSVGLLVHGEAVSRTQVGNNIHSDVLLSMVEEVLTYRGISIDDIDAVAVGQGPGSFTGLRIGVGAAQGLAFGANVPMIGVSSLEILAFSAIDSGADAVISGIDARMGEIYWAEYQVINNALVGVGDARVSPPEDIVVGAQSCVLVGNAWGEYEARLPQPVTSRAKLLADVVYPDADSLLQLAANKYKNKQTVTAADFKPTYIRNNVAKKSTKPLPGKRIE